MSSGSPGRSPVRMFTKKPQGVFRRSNKSENLEGASNPSVIPPGLKLWGGPELQSLFSEELRLEKPVCRLRKKIMKQSRCTATEKGSIQRLTTKRADKTAKRKIKDKGLMFSYELSQQPHKGLFSKSETASFVSEAEKRGASLPSSAEYGRLPLRGPSGGTISMSRPKSDVEWAIYRAKSTPGPGDYDLSSSDITSLHPCEHRVHGITISGRNYTTRKHSGPGPARYTVPSSMDRAASTVGGGTGGIGVGKFSVGNPKSDVEWKILRAKFTPGPCDTANYSLSGMQASSHSGRFSSSDRILMGEWIQKREKRRPGSAEYTRVRWPHKSTLAHKAWENNQAVYNPCGRFILGKQRRKRQTKNRKKKKKKKKKKLAIHISVPMVTEGLHDAAHCIKASKLGVGETNANESELSSLSKKVLCSYDRAISIKKEKCKREQSHAEPSKRMGKEDSSSLLPPMSEPTYQAQLLDRESLFLDLLQPEVTFQRKLWSVASTLFQWLVSHRCSHSVVRLVRPYDKDGDGALSPSEFSSMLKDLLSPVEHKKLSPYTLLWCARCVAGPGRNHSGLSRNGTLPLSRFDVFVNTFWHRAPTPGSCQRVLRAATARLYGASRALSCLDHAVARATARVCLVRRASIGHVMADVGCKMVNGIIFQCTNKVSKTESQRRCAARDIQAAWRGHIIYTLFRYTILPSICRIQGVFREWRWRKRNFAATVIQSIARMWSGYRRFRSFASALKTLQLLFRMWRAKNRRRRATQIQAWVRSSVQQQRYLRFRRYAVINLQIRFRRWRLLRRRTAAKFIQAWTRKAILRYRYKRYKWCILFFQLRFKFQFHDRRRKAAIRLNASFRAYISKLKYSIMHHGFSSFQLIIKWWCWRRQRSFRRQAAALKLQTFVRMYFQRGLFLTKRGVCIVFQRQWRTFLMRKFASISIQNFGRMVTLRAWFLRTTPAAVRLQNWCRTSIAVNRWIVWRDQWISLQSICRGWHVRHVLSAVRRRHYTGGYKDVFGYLRKNEFVVIYYKNILLHTSKRKVGMRRIVLTNRGRFLLLREGGRQKSRILGNMSKVECDRIKKHEQKRRKIFAKSTFASYDKARSADLWTLESAIEQPLFTGANLFDQRRGRNSNKLNEYNPFLSKNGPERSAKSSKKSQNYCLCGPLVAVRPKIPDNSKLQFILEFAPDMEKATQDKCQNKSRPFEVQVNNLAINFTRKLKCRARLNELKHRDVAHCVDKLLNHISQPQTIEEWMSTWFWI